jgi:aspartyl-tRNA(Asn)/glutamyl-tRNA(Gln) amidotransferase subunit A
MRDLADSVISGKTDLKSLVDFYINNIKEKNTELNAYLEVFSDIDEQISNLKKRISNKEELPLAGIPLAVKDNILIKGHVASASSKILEDYVASYDATVITKLRNAGAIFIGRTNMDEFAMGASTENSAFGVTKNPIDTTRVSGGSSGGSVVAVAARMAHAALGSETGGSVRQPASFCGVVGLKPTYGSVSRHGLMAMASSLDQIGPVTKNVADAKLLFSVIEGKDAMDSTSYRPDSLSDKTPKKIAYPKNFITEDIDDDVLQNFKESIKKLEQAGYEVEAIKIPELEYALATYYVLVPAEVSANLARFDGVRYGLSEKGSDVTDNYFKTRGKGFGKEVRRRILLGAYVLSAGYYDAYYKKANGARVVIKEALKGVFTKYDAIIIPTSPIPAFKIGERANDPVEMYLADIFTVSANLAGIPAISVPSGTISKEGKNLPLGLQIMAPAFSENVLFKIGEDFEQTK